MQYEQAKNLLYEEIFYLVTIILDGLIYLKVYCNIFINKPNRINKQAYEAEIGKIAYLKIKLIKSI